MDDDAPPGVPEWVVTYGDMMSLLLTFFIMLVSMSEVVADQKYQAVMAALHEYLGYRSAPAAPPGDHFPLNSRTEGRSSLGSFHDADQGRGGIRPQGANGSDFDILRMPEGSPSRIGRPLHFAAGSAELSGDEAVELRKIVAELAGKPNKIEIRGHAAPGPLATDAKSPDKIALTYERARAVAESMRQMGIAADRCRLTAAADTQPLPDVGDQTGQRQDRVEVLMLDTFAADYIGPATESR